jgi:hypothetical protein
MDRAQLRQRVLVQLSMERMAKRILAYACLVAGVAGLVLPLVPGIPLLILGFNLLEPDHWLRKRASTWATGLRNSR